MERLFHTPLMFTVVTEGFSDWDVARRFQTMVGASDWVDKTDPVAGFTPLMGVAFRDDEVTCFLAH